MCSNDVAEESDSTIYLLPKLLWLWANHVTVSRKKIDLGFSSTG
jgi:hypothetical protein